MDRVAVCISDYDIDYSPSIVNLIDCLSDHSRVDVYLRGVNVRSSPVLLKDSVSVFLVRTELEVGNALRLLDRAARRLAKRVLGRPLPASDAKARRVSAKAVAGGENAASYDRVVCIDPHGFLLAKELFPTARPVYYSLELYLRDDYLDEYYPEATMLAFRRVMDRERAMISDIEGLIIQSRERADLFLGDYGLGRDLPLFFLPVTCTGAGSRTASSLLRERYQIPPSSRIALHLGGMNDWHSSLEIARVFCTLPQWALVFQGNHNRGYLKRFRADSDVSQAANIIVSDTFYPDLESLDPVIASADVGIAWYNDITKNFTSAGRSTGKIASYTKFGLPVMATRYPSFEAAVSATGCGVCVDEVGEIPDALARIASDYESFSAAALREYEATYRFESYRQPLIDFVARPRSAL
jgi:hypothetical protein